MIFHNQRKQSQTIQRGIKERGENQKKLEESAKSIEEAEKNQEMKSFDLTRPDKWTKLV